MYSHYSKGNSHVISEYKNQSLLVDLLAPLVVADSEFYVLHQIQQ